jgi:hypothetical protein
MKISSALLITAVALGSSFALAQDMPALVAKPYPGAVPERMKDGKQLPADDIGNNRTVYAFLTRDPIDTVKAFYAREGIKLEPLAAKERLAVGGWTSNFEHAMRVDLDASPSALTAAPLEYYQTKGADDEPSYFNGLIVMTAARKTPQKADDKGRQAMIDDMVVGHFALSSVSKIMVPLYGNIFMEPAQLVPHYNRHLTMLSGYFREINGNSAVKMKYIEMHPDWTLPMGATGGGEMNAKQDAMRTELREILARKPDKRAEYRSLTRGAGSKEKRAKVQPEVDKLLLSDPELAAWKKRSDALAQQEKEASAKPNIRAVRDEDVEAFLQALEKEVYPTRILIHASGGRRVTRDAATIRREWRF